MNTYRFCFKYCGIHDIQYECDADAMMKSREYLKTMQKLNPSEKVYVWCKNPEPSKTYRLVAAYK